MKWNVNIQKFSLPNFLRFESPVRRREEGFKEGPRISVGELTDEQATEYWDWMKAEWLAHVAKRREESA